MGKKAERNRSRFPASEDARKKEKGLPEIAYRPSYVCNTCGKSYKWKVSLNLHKRMECGIEPRFPCSICGRRFKHKHHLMKHHRSIHSCTDQWRFNDDLEARSFNDTTTL
ncbi:uncharacterized protein LOC117224521 [Megalopta genalis]|uniref:uncharacterized protein LOC117224521 n=1 Tax=Megalopta genalis TaxID=115081 RepID=UPI0014437A35|nr:zinc finger protein 775-like [Megalopta genalis]